MSRTKSKSIQTWLAEREHLIMENDYYDTPIFRYMRMCKRTMTVEAYASLMYFLGETQTSITCLQDPSPNNRGASTSSSGQLYVTKTDDAIDKFAKAIDLLTDGNGVVRLQLVVMDSNEYEYDDTNLDEPVLAMYIMWVTWETGSMSPMMVDYIFPDYYCGLDKNTLKY